MTGLQGTGTSSFSTSVKEESTTDCNREGQHRPSGARGQGDASHGGQGAQSQRQGRQHSVLFGEEAALTSG